MIAVTGIFKSGTEAEHAAQRLRSLGIEGEHRLNVLAPGATDREIAKVPTSDTEQPGMGAAVIGVVGGASGLAVGTAVTSLLIPGVGPVVAIGILASGLIGSLAGVAAGDAMEDSMTDGTSRDEMFLYEDALRQGRTVVIALAENDEQAKHARQALAESGAESIDAARHAWWIGLRDHEKDHYAAEGKDFAKAEPVYRRGFEAAQHPDLRGRTYEAARERLRKSHPDEYDDDSFQRGYERGAAYFRSLRQK